jgi:replicative DNA helicase
MILMLTESPTFATTNLRVPPQDLGAERALLGAVLIKPDTLNDVVELVTKEAFYASRHRIIFEAMVALADVNEPIDAVSVSSYLKERNQLDNVGGNSYIAELLESVPAASNAAYYAEIVYKKSALRQLIDAAGKISELGFTEHEPIDSIFDKAEKLVFGLANFSKKRLVSLKDTLIEAWDRFERLHADGESLRGVPTGFRDLDAKLAGLQPSDLIILAARPSMGKTSLALNIARNVAKANVPVAIFSLEMSSQQLVDRVLASESRVDSWKLRTGKLNMQDELDRIQEALNTLSNLPIYIDDEPSNNITKMRGVARRLKAEGKLGLIIVDYLQLMVPRKDSDSVVQQITEISRSLKALARELDVPVLALSQLSRAVEQRGGRPRLSDLRDSGSIEQDADVVMFIHREDKYNEASDRKNIAEIMIEKHRNGPTGKIELYFDDVHVSFNTIERADFGAF